MSEICRKCKKEEGQVVTYLAINDDTNEQYPITKTILCDSCKEEIDSAVIDILIKHGKVTVVTEEE